MKKVELRPKITVLGWDINIEIKRMKNWGEYESAVKKMYISDKCTQEQAEHTSFHETLHAILDISGQSALLNSEEQEEALVVALEHGLWPLIRQGVWKCNSDD